MQLSRLYSNDDTVFTPIDFHSGEKASILNVIYADVLHKKSREKDCHNLGKTTLIHLLDFLLLKEVSENNCFLIKHKDIFSDFIFYLELLTHSGEFITIRRSVASPTEISLKHSIEGGNDFTDLKHKEWEHWHIPLSTANSLLDSYLALTAISSWPFRKGVSYFLRGQSDYQDYFQISKYIQGKDRAWKPYLAGMLDLDHEAVGKKYVLDDEIAILSAEKDKKQAEILLENVERGALVTKIIIEKDEISQIDTRLDKFDFSEEERKISKKVVDEIEAKISNLNERLYDLDVDIAQLQSSIQRGMSFDLKKIKEIFDETKIALPDAVTRSYDELVDFNKSLTKERNATLKSRIKELSARREKLLLEHQQFNEKRQELLEIIKNADTFKKYKGLQKEQSKRRTDLTFLEVQLNRIDAVEKLDREISEKKKERQECVSNIDSSLFQGSQVLTDVTKLFNRYVKKVLNINGHFIVQINSAGNLDFKIKTTDASGKDTSQDEGTTYKKLLCALFDLAVLKALESKPFYHFVYHDGILEGLDNRKRLTFLELIQDILAEGTIQYIISLINSDLPRDLHNDEPIMFSQEEIILTLNDQGDSGRLFKMPPF